MSDSTSASNEVNAAGPIPQSSLPFPVVGIGASAGGLQALSRFFENAPAKMDMAFVVVMHLSPSYPSNADQVLQKATRMRVMQVVEPVPIEKNRVYVIAPGKTLSMADGYLRVSDRERTGGVPVTIDHSSERLPARTDRMRSPWCFLEPAATVRLELVVLKN